MSSDHGKLKAVEGFLENQVMYIKIDGRLMDFQILYLSGVLNFMVNVKEVYI
jgi:hypothetical protein